MTAQTAALLTAAWLIISPFLLTKPPSKEAKR